MIAQAAAEIQGIEFADVLDRRPTFRAAALLAAACLLAGGLIAIEPVGAEISVTRLLNPLGNTTWPRTTNLAIRQAPDRVARGQAFQIEVVDQYGARLPAEVRIHYRAEAADGKVAEESGQMRFADGKGDTSNLCEAPSGPFRQIGLIPFSVPFSVIARRENVQQPFSYRVEGGDDRSMPWSDVEVVDPPAVESLSIRLVPPAYTGWPAVESPRHIRALVGTRVEIAGRATKPLRSAELCLEGGRRIPARLGDDGLSFTVGTTAAVGTPSSPAVGAAVAPPPPTEFVVEKSGSYWFELTDDEGLQGGGDDRWEIHAVADAPPVVSIQQPAANLLVTPRAVVPVRVSAKDDLAVRDVTLVFRAGDAGPERTVPLWTGGPQASPAPAAEGFPSPARRQPHGRLPLGTGPAGPAAGHPGDLPRDGQRLSAADRPQRAAATYRGHARRTARPARRARKTDRRRVGAGGRDAAGVPQSGPVAVAILPAVLASRLRRSDVDQLQAAEHAQQDVAQLLTSRSEGLPMHVTALLADLENNRIPAGDVQRRMAGLLEELDRLGRDRLPMIGRELTAARKTAQADREVGAGKGDRSNLPERPGGGFAQIGPVPFSGRVSASLLAAAGQQDAVIAALEQWLRQLARWDSYGRFHRELAQLLREQEELTRRTADVGRRTLAQDLRDLGPQDAAGLNVAAATELDLARRLDRTLQEMEQAAGQLRPGDPLAADTVLDALDQARRLGVAAEMRTAGAEIGQNQIGQAAAGQKQIAQDLQEVLDILANRQAEAARLVKRLRQVESDLSALEQQQAGLAKQIDAKTEAGGNEARRELERLAVEQQRLRQEAERLARQLERLQSDRAAAAAGQAAEEMDQAGQRAAAGDRAGASGQAAAARQSLADARGQLAERLRQAAAELAFEQIARLDDLIKHLRRQQRNALDEARRLWQLERSQGNLTRAQASSVGDLGRLQHSLQDDTARLAKQLAGAGAFQLALGGAVGEMQDAAASLDRRQTGPPTQEPQGRALRATRSGGRGDQARAARGVGGRRQRARRQGRPAANAYHRHPAPCGTQALEAHARGHQLPHREVTASRDAGGQADRGPNPPVPRVERAASPPGRHHPEIAPPG